jgi:glycosyltransferase involved in cell wall biosynthesis
MFYGRVVARRLAARQDEVIAVSRTTARDVESLFRVPTERLTVIPNGLDHGQFHAGSQSAARSAVCIPRGLFGPFFLYVARLEHPAKNHAGLIEAFNRFKASTGSNWKLVLVGSDGRRHTRTTSSGSALCLLPILPTGTGQPTFSSSLHSLRDSGFRQSRPWPAPAPFSHHHPAPWERP